MCLRLQDVRFQDLSIASKPVIPRRVRLPFTTHLEERLAMYLEYSPHVRTYQRGDASLACAKTYDLAIPLGTPYRINYIFDGKPHEYLPDYVGTFCDGGLLIAEAGREEEKSQGRALVKAEAARRLAQIKGGEYWIGQRSISSSAVTRTGCISTLAVNLSPPFKKLQRLFYRLALRGHAECE